MGKVWFFPIDFTWDAYATVLGEKGIWVAYANTLFYTIVGVAVNLVMTILGAYPLSKKRLWGRSKFNFFIVCSMIFGAGMIPFYLTLRQLGFLDSRMALIIPFAVVTFYVLILRSFFQSIPDEMEEAAKVDGANDIEILMKIYLPMSLPSLAALGLFYAVFKWNGYFWAMVLLRDENKIPLQVLLNKLIVKMNLSEELASAATDTAYDSSVETIIYATIMVASLPIIMVYPFIQKYFVKGAMIGSVKG